MLKKRNILFFLIFILFISCTENNLNPVLYNNIETNSLAKKSWNISPIYNWPTHTIYDDLYDAYFTYSDTDYYFTFDNYQYHLVYIRQQTNGGSGTYKNTVKIYVNSIYSSSRIWYNSDGGNNSSKWLGWFSFSHNGVSMKINLFISEDYIPMEDWSQPFKVQVKVFDLYVSPDTPNNFTVSPQSHPGTTSNPKLTWSQTSDGDVTHVEIWRRNNSPSTSYSKIATISKSYTSYTDYSCNWKLPLGRTYWYKIRFKDATHNLYSSFTSEKFSSSM